MLIELVNFSTKNTPSDNVKTIQKAIDSLCDGDVLRFEHKTYYINNYLEIKNLNNIEIDGNGAKFININFDPCSQYFQNLTFFRICNCKNIRFGNFTCDYDKLLNLTGTIINIGDSYLDILVIKENLPLTGKEKIQTINNFNEDLEIDDTLAHSTPNYYDIELLKDDVLRIYCPIQEAKVGQKVYCSYSMKASPALDYQTSENVFVHDITLFAASHFANYISPNSKNYTFERFRAIVPPNSERLITLNADGIHSGGIEGYLKLRDCEFVGLGDDCLNIHTCSARVISIDGNAIVVEESYFKRQLSDTWGKPGHVVSYYDSKEFIERDTSKIIAIEGFYEPGLDEHIKNGDSGEKKYTTITLNKPLKNLKVGDFIVNTTVLPSVTISNCHFEKGRARGLVLRTHDVIVEDCYFKGFALPGILISADLDYWFEMIPSKNVTIRNNKFINTCLFDAEKNLGVISIKLSDDNVFYNYGYNIFNNINILNNYIEGANYCGIFAQSTNGILIANNTIKNVNRGKNKNRYTGYSVSLLNVSNEAIENNIVEDEISIEEI